MFKTTILFIVSFITWHAAFAQLVIENNNRPYMVVDKVSAQIFIYSEQGKLIGQAPALLGQTKGDVDKYVSNTKKISEFKLDERITPSGKFKIVAGKDLEGRDVLWFDYSAMLAIHSSNQGPAYNRRKERLKSNDPSKRRITLGCIVLEPEFFKNVVFPALGKGNSFLYVLPESPVKKMKL